ncbi:hypothetical protein [Limibacterium fermenti]|uniref:hypothetical protein n=1 Tax=Limibacterium fermenti TaxID=3229863 RepID=UPI003A6E445E
MKALQTIFDSAEQELYQLNIAQKQSIESGRKDIENGNSQPNDIVMEKMTRWLEKQD